MWDRRTLTEHGKTDFVNNCTRESCPERLIEGWFWGIFGVGLETAAPARVVLKTNFGLGGSRMGRPFLILVSLYFPEKKDFIE